MAGSRGPSKLLYAIGGFVLGNIAGGALLLTAGAFFPVGSVALGVCYLAAAGCALTGAVIGWKKASREQRAAGAPTVVSTTVSRNVAEDMSPELAPELTRDQALAQAEAQHAEFNVAHETHAPRIHASFSAEPQEQQTNYIQYFKPTTSKTEAVQAERAEPQEAARY